jgi:DNA-binding NarL/FixJ family response regulator
VRGLSKSDLAAAGLREAVHRLVSEGLSNPEIAARLHVSDETIKNEPRSARILTKLGLRDGVHSVVRAYEAGWWLPNHWIVGAQPF